MDCNRENRQQNYFGYGISVTVKNDVEYEMFILRLADKVIKYASVY